MSDFFSYKHFDRLPRIPLEGKIDLTYRCDNNCLHCWLWRPANSPEQKDELTFDEIKNIVDQARAMGTQKWSISGGEPMLRLDFPEIFDYVTSKAVSYSLNTNGTLITPAIAQQLKLKGTKMIALYGATAETYDKVTRHPGGFEMAMRGFRYMQEAGAGFIVQLVPMRVNWHEWQQMVELAESLSKHWRVGASWLYLSADGNSKKNKEIISQRLDPKDVIALDPPTMGYPANEVIEPSCTACEDQSFGSCIRSRRDFHIDPYGGITFCSFIKDPEMIYDLRKGSVQDFWDNFLPAVAQQIVGGNEYKENCGSCENRSNCRWCGVYGYLEYGRYSAPVDYLCKVANESRKYQEEWMTNNRRYFNIADITIQVDSDLPILDDTFTPAVDQFRVKTVGEDVVKLRHHFSLPDINQVDLGKEVYRQAPWAIYQQASSWHYLGIAPDEKDKSLHSIAVFNRDHTSAELYSKDQTGYSRGNWNSLTLFPTDQILIARLLADRRGFYLHSAGAIINGKGLLFVGHSEAGKSTTTQMLMKAGSGESGYPALDVEILCDDRNIIRKFEDGWKVYGSWSHGDVDVVSPASAPLKGICFIEQSKVNSITPLHDRKDIATRLMTHVIKPLATKEWWNKTLDSIEKCAVEVPFYVMQFDKSGSIVKEIEKLTQ